MKIQPTQVRLRALFAYNDAVGCLVCRTARSRRTPAGTRAGNRRVTDGYRILRVEGVDILEHRAIWIHRNGDIPAGMEIDHIDGVRDNNRIANLRLVSHSTNTKNKRKYAKQSELPTGVTRCGLRFKAVCGSGASHVYIGLFDTAEAAHFAYLSAIKRHKYHPNHSKVIPG